MKKTGEELHSELILNNLSKAKRKSNLPITISQKLNEAITIIVILDLRLITRTSL